MAEFPNDPNLTCVFIACGEGMALSCLAWTHAWSASGAIPSVASSTWPTASTTLDQETTVYQ